MKKTNDLVPPALLKASHEGAGKERGSDISSYFLVRRRTSDSDAVSPKFSPPREPTALETRSHQSGGSARGPYPRANSIASDSQSVISRNQHVRNWNESSMGLTSLFSSIRHTTHPMDPPRPARDGLEWVWFPEGYWAEREIRDFSPGFPSMKPGSRPKWWNRSSERKSKGSDKSGKAETSSRTTPPTAPVDLPRIHKGSLLSRKASKVSKPATNEHSASTTRKNSGGQHGDKTNRLDIHANMNIPKYYAIAPAEQLGLYCRTKKTIRTKFLQKATVADDVSLADIDAGKVASRTTMILEGTSHYLDRVERERYPPSDMYTSSATSHTPGTPGSRSLRRFGLAPWHRRSSHESNLSASSSVFKLLLGKAPSATPDPEHQYEAKDGRAYQKVDISSPDPLEPNYLPSEAKRVNTPPMFPGTPTVQARGFFFDLNATSRGDNFNQSTSGGSTGSSSIAAIKRSAGTSPSVDWWEADTKHVFTGSKATRALSPPGPSFELNLPEHLPSSPLCPKNPKHTSGGIGICPYHGRKRSNNLKNIKTADSQESGAAPRPLRTAAGD